MALNISSHPEAFQFKGGSLTVTTLELFTADVALIERDLELQTRRAPAFFSHTPVILAFDRLSDDQGVSLDLIVAVCKRSGLMPIAVRCFQDAIKQSAWALGLGWFPPQSEKRQQDVDSARARSASTVKPSHVVRAPVRSGQQIYARETDLIIIGSVNEGAEVIADGNVHIWGPLRGKAIAGAQGNQEALIFCQQFRAELVSVAGVFQTFEKEDWQENASGVTQISLQNDRLIID